MKREDNRVSSRLMPEAFGCLVAVGGDVLASSTGYATYGLVLDVAETSYAALACDCCTEGVDDEGG